VDCVGYVVKWVYGWFRRLWWISAHSGGFGVGCLFGLYTGWRLRIEMSHTVESLCKET